MGVRGRKMSTLVLIAVCKGSVFFWHVSKLPTKEQTSTSFKHVGIANRLVALKSLYTNN